MNERINDLEVPCPMMPQCNIGALLCSTLHSETDCNMNFHRHLKTNLFNHGLV